MKKEDISNVRHSLAHLLGASVLKLYPEAQITLGPAIDGGFYYDVDFGSKKIGDNDLKDIQKQMRKMIGSWDKFEEQEVSADKARETFKDNKYKLELIDEILEKAKNENREPRITLYQSGDFVDLCKGGHVESMKDIDPKSFKLDRVAGAYWRGDEKNQMLTRIYGLAFHTPEELSGYERQREMAKERDHRKIGKEMGLFTFSDLVGAGLPMFTPKGTAMRNAIVNKIKGIQSAYGYQEVWIPHITKPELYKTSGHWDKFGDELFKVKGKESEFVMKPMNCPHHTQIYASQPRSYKDLPIRFMEATTNYRDEQTGELLGLTRVRSLTQDDGHVFCTEDQISQEIGIIADVIEEFYSSLGMWNKDTYWVRLSAMDRNNPDKYIGDQKIWDYSEDALEKIAKERGFNYKKVEGEAAFYGPKLDFMFKDAIGREWQLGTIQLDFNMPKRFELEYTDRDGKKKNPVMIHRAIAGAIERFMGVIIEHFAGSFPLWLSPVQVKIIPIADTHMDKAREVAKKLKDFRYEIDSSDDGFGKKVNKAKKEKVPYFIIIGDKDIEVDKITLESRDNGQIGQISIEEAVEKLKEEL